MTDTNAFIKRVLPSGFSWMPMQIKTVNGYGNVTLDKSGKTALFAKYPELITSAVAYVETHGSDATGAINDITKPYATIATALQTSAKTIVLGNGYHQFAGDYRSTQAAGGAMKLVMARNPRQAVIRRAGAKLSALVWTAVNSTVYQTQIAGSGAWFADSPHRVLLATTKDEHGYSTRLPYFAPPTQDATGVTTAVANLTTAGTGWTWDGATRTLYVALGGADVQASRASLDALYRSASGTDQILLYGAKLAFDGVAFEGTLLWALPSGAVASEVWLNDCRSFCSIGYGIQADAGCTLVADGVTIHASAADGVNQDSTRGGSATSYAQIANTYITQSGDVQTYGLGQSQNRQAISSHAGYLTVTGSVFEKNWGQEVADTASAAPYSSWYVGCVARNGDTRQGATTGFSFTGRSAWLDTCATEGMTNHLVTGSGAVAKTFNCNFAADTYTPSTP